MPSSLGVRAVLLAHTGGAKNISEGDSLHLRQCPAHVIPGLTTSISAYSTPVQMHSTHKQPPRSAGGPIRSSKFASKSVDLTCTEEMMPMEAMVMARPSKNWRAAVCNEDPPLQQQGDPCMKDLSFSPLCFKTPCYSRRCDRNLQRKGAPFSSSKHGPQRLWLREHDAQREFTGIQERQCFTSEECMIQFPPYEELLLLRQAWEGEGDGVHGESLALFKPGSLRIPGFSQEQAIQHASEYYWHVRKLQDPLFHPTDPWEGPMCSEWNKNAHTQDMSSQILHSPVFKYPKTFVQHVKQIPVLLSFIELTFSACGGEIGNAALLRASPSLDQAFY
jgi:hypothetical protein